MSVVKTYTQYRLDWIVDYFTEDMNTEYVYPNAFMSRENTDRLAVLTTDITQNINENQARWIMNGFTDADWDALPHRFGK